MPLKVDGGKEEFPEHDIRCTVSIPIDKPTVAVGFLSSRASALRSITRFGRTLQVHDRQFSRRACTIESEKGLHAMRV